MSPPTLSLCESWQCFYRNPLQKRQGNVMSISMTEWTLSLSMYHRQHRSTQCQNWSPSMYHLSIPMISCGPQRLIPLEQSSSPFNQRYHHWGSQIGGHCPLDWIVAWFWLMSCILNLRDCARAHYQSVHNLTFQSFQWCSCAEGVPLI